MSKKKITFYSMLESLTGAGVSFERILSRSVPRDLRGVCEGLSQDLVRGMSLNEAMSHQGHEFSKLEIAVIRAGELTGSVERSAGYLREHFERQVQFWSELVSGLMLPIIYYIISGPLLKVIDLAIGRFGKGGGLDFSAWLKPIVLRCVYWWGIPVVLFILLRLLGNVLSGSRMVDRILGVIPIVGRIRHYRDSVSIWETFSICVSSGFTYIQSLRLTASTAVSPFARARLNAMAYELEHSSKSFSEAFSGVATHLEAVDSIPEIIAVGEETGTLDDAAARIAKNAQFSLEENIKRLSKVVPLVIYLILLVFLGIKVVEFYSNYVQMLQ